MFITRCFASSEFDGVAIGHHKVLLYLFRNSKETKVLKLILVGNHNCGRLKENYFVHHKAHEMIVKDDKFQECKCEFWFVEIPLRKAA